MDSLRSLGGGRKGGEGDLIEGGCGGQGEPRLGAGGKKPPVSWVHVEGFQSDFRS